MSFLRTLRAGPPPPKVALLPDGLFFTRAVPIAPGATPAEAAAQVELALETIAPFPLAQLYYGSYWVPGATRALVYAAYRRRFTADQTAAWDGTALVLPAFAAVLGAEPRAGATVILSAADGLTAVHWEGETVPASVSFRPLPPPAEEETEETLAQAEKAREVAREELIRAIGGSHTVIDVAATPAPEPSRAENDVVFRAGPVISTLPAAVVAAMDVRDKVELAQIRAARRRDVMLWNVALGCAAALILLAVGELALVGGKQWQGLRKKKQIAQQPTVENIMKSQALTQRIEDLRTKRLLPFEMIYLISGKLPHGGPGNEIVFTRTMMGSQGLYTIRVEAKTANPGLISTYRSELERLPAVEKVEFLPPKTIDNNATFTFTVTFKPDAVKPYAAPSE